MKALINFDNKISLVTGAGSSTGIGFAAARILGELGARVVVVVSTTERIHERANELKALDIEARGYIADLLDRKQVTALINSIIGEYGRIDILVNNAGMTQVGSPEDFTPFAEMIDENWDFSIARNLTVPYNVTRAVLPHMLECNYGRIVNTSSVTGPIVSNPGESSYSAAKAAIVGMSRAIAIEVAKNNITINNVLPGWVATGSQTEEEAAAASYTPIGRSARPEEIGYMIAFLASEQASYITGQNFVVDGGSTLPDAVLI